MEDEYVEPSSSPVDSAVSDSAAETAANVASQVASETAHRATEDAVVVATSVATEAAVEEAAQVAENTTRDAQHEHLTRVESRLGTLESKIDHIVGHLSSAPTEVKVEETKPQPVEQPVAPSAEREIAEIAPRSNKRTLAHRWFGR